MTVRPRTAHVAIATCAWLIALGTTNCGGSTAPSLDAGVAGDAAPPSDAHDAMTDAMIDGGTATDAGTCGAECTQNYNQGSRAYRACCGDACVNPTNDPFNCGGCGVTCSGATPFCNDGTCEAPPCQLDGGAPAGATCCGTSICSSGQICCLEEGPVGGYSSCITPTASHPTCAMGCAPLCISDRALKRDVRPVDPQRVLDALDKVPMSTWSYKSDDPAVRHLGPMAQDLHSAFGLGDTERAYDPIDAHGLAFASIQALHAMVKEQNARIERLERENQALRARLRAH